MNSSLSTFQRFPLTIDQTLQASILTDLQKSYIHNQRAEIAEEIISLTIDLSNPGVYALRKAELQGQLNMYTLMLERSDNAEVELRHQIIQSSFEQRGEESGVPQDTNLRPTPSVDFSKF
jgi:hypothetical protein